MTHHVGGPVFVARGDKWSTDLSIPLAGVPIHVHRTYDTLHATHRGDFVYGWTLGLAQANLRESVHLTEAKRSGITAIFGAAPVASAE